ncbi:MAG: hypothetical protein KR126chlam5_01211 [Candidatus Anoxychlamydiales bacterium]|nr:hypothetical protein [Candidatus Anoxychlamydiales bacterium]
MYKILLFLNLIFFSLYGLELERVILSTTNNPSYIEFWPIVAPIWESIGLRPTLALIADEKCPIDTSIGDVIRFAPLEGVPESLQAQVIRLLLPILFPDDGCLIADIDMIPISQSYFHEGSAPCSEDAFIVYRNMAPGYEKGGRFPMCYIAAKGKIFSDIFGINSYEEIPKLIRSLAQKGYGWSTDEITIYTYAKKWEKNGGDLICLNHRIGPRLDRIRWNIDFNNLDISKYIDCHCPRPYSTHRNLIDKVIQAIRMK